MRSDLGAYDVRKDLWKAWNSGCRTTEGDHGWKRRHLTRARLNRVFLLVELAHRKPGPVVPGLASSGSWPVGLSGTRTRTRGPANQQREAPWSQLKRPVHLLFADVTKAHWSFDVEQPHCREWADEKQGIQVQLGAKRKVVSRRRRRRRILMSGQGSSLRTRPGKMRLMCSSASIKLRSGRSPSQSSDQTGFPGLPRSRHALGCTDNARLDWP